MFSLSDCSIVIPVQIDSEERLEHVHFQDRFFRENFSNYRLIIVEQGMESKVQLEGVVFVKSEEVFSPSVVSNIGARLVNTPFFCKYDADALIHPKAIYDAFELLKKGQTLVLPYNGLSFSIGGKARKKMLESADISSLNEKDLSLKSDCSVGLIHHFRTDVFKELGGYDEEFIGWGYEDSEIINRFRILGHPRVLLEKSIAFHLEHPRGSGDEAQIFRNYCRKQMLNAMSADELRKLKES